MELSLSITLNGIRRKIALLYAMFTHSSINAVMARGLPVDFAARGIAEVAKDSDTLAPTCFSYLLAPLNREAELLMEVALQLRLVLSELMVNFKVS
ncbi:MAG: hypothetical protein SFY66_05830 [Oculatellaceae cyanobacterium bins.114]|nr:hypothetical protein [Oculatellaceae cyanobacterium bins.114]